MSDARPKIAMYSHDTMGLGHMRRNLLIAQTLRERLGATVLMISGAWEGGLFDLAEGIDCVTLPALKKDPDGRYQSRRLDVPYRELIRLRAMTIEASLRAFGPDLLVVDKVPAGVGGELLPALRRLRRGRHARCILGLRDILDDAATVRREWRDDDSASVVDDYYDAVWVYGDPAVYDVVGEYGLPSGVADKVHYTGYLNRRPTLAPTACRVADALAPLRLPAGRLALCMVGGGQDGEAVANAFAGATLPAGTNGLILTGPFMPAHVRRTLLRASADSERLRVLEFASDTAPLLMAADRVVTMGGYNTVCEVLSYHKRALVVPRVRPRREQLVRAQRLEQLGLLDVLHPDALTPSAVGQWLATEHAGGAPTSAGAAVDFGGLDRLPELVRAARSTQRASHHPRRAEARVSHVIG
jgi:predicted glycosyltransferase